jgi:hypothetical protein
MMGRHVSSDHFRRESFTRYSPVRKFPVERAGSISQRAKDSALEFFEYRRY